MSATNTRKKPSETASTPQPLDRTDRAILKALQRDASISNVALAEKVKLSAPACLRRVERLKQAGLIKHIVALLDNEALEAGMVVLIGWCWIAPRRSPSPHSRRPRRKCPAAWNAMW